MNRYYILVVSFALIGISANIAIGQYQRVNNLVDQANRHMASASISEAKKDWRNAIGELRMAEKCANSIIAHRQVEARTNPREGRPYLAHSVDTLLTIQSRIAYLYALVGDNQSSNNYVQHLSKVAKHEPVIQFHFGRIAMLRNNLKGAITHFSVGIRIVRNDNAMLSMLHHWRAHCFFELGLYRDALTDIERCSEIDPGNAQVVSFESEIKARIAAQYKSQSDSESNLDSIRKELAQELDRINKGN